MLEDKMVEQVRIKEQKINYSGFHGDFYVNVSMKEEILNISMLNVETQEQHGKQFLFSDLPAGVEYFLEDIYAFGELFINALLMDNVDIQKNGLVKIEYRTKLEYQNSSVKRIIAIKIQDQKFTTDNQTSIDMKNSSKCLALFLKKNKEAKLTIQKLEIEKVKIEDRLIEKQIQNQLIHQRLSQEMEKNKSINQITLESLTQQKIKLENKLKEKETQGNEILKTLAFFMEKCKSLDKTILKNLQKENEENQVKFKQKDIQNNRLYNHLAILINQRKSVDKILVQNQIKEKMVEELKIQNNNLLKHLAKLMESNIIQEKKIIENLKKQKAETEIKLGRLQASKNELTKNLQLFTSVSNDSETYYSLKKRSIRYDFNFEKSHPDYKQFHQKKHEDAAYQQNYTQITISDKKDQTNLLVSSISLSKTEICTFNFKNFKAHAAKNMMIGLTNNKENVKICQNQQRQYCYLTEKTNKQCLFTIKMINEVFIDLRSQKIWWFSGCDKIAEKNIHVQLLRKPLYPFLAVCHESFKIGLSIWKREKQSTSEIEEQEEDQYNYQSGIELSSEKEGQEEEVDEKVEKS